jgi:hypothetical protein
MPAKARTTKAAPSPAPSAPVVTIADTARAVFSTKDGKALLAHLESRFGLTSRVFLPAPDGFTLCPLRAAVRDGERAVVAHLHFLIDSAAGKLAPPKS